MDALIFDFDGVVVNSEPVHCATFQLVLQGRGVNLTQEDYYGKYLGFDDHDCFAGALRDAGLDFTESQIAEMIADKTLRVKEAFAESIQPLPGVVELIRSAAGAGVHVGVCSGALKDEIELASRAIGTRQYFSAIVSAEDVPRGKPDPCGYRVALAELGRAAGRELCAARSVAIEDAPAGITAAHEAGMKVLAVTNSYAPQDLHQADRIVASLGEVALADLEDLLLRK